MAEVTLSYSIMASGNGYTPPHNVNLILTYDPAAQNQDGSFTATAARGTYVVNPGAGAAGGEHTDNITGLVAQNSFNGNDNKIWINSTGTPNYVDNNGIAFTIAYGNNGNDTDRDYRPNVRFHRDAPNSYSEDNVGGTTAGPSVNPTTPAQPAPCYVSGTRLRVLQGFTIEDVPVERLRVGDVALTASGKPRPIRWLGTRSYPGLTAPKHDCPVRIRAGALGDGVPARDLFVSPDHCLWLDGLLVAAGHLVNGTSITRGAAVADLTYWHVELDTHDMLLAEGAAAESFLAAPGVRRGFDGVGDAAELAIAQTPYAPRIERHDPRLDALRTGLILRAGLSIEPARFGAVRAWLDVCDGERVAGWARDEAHPDAPVCLDILVDGEIVAMAFTQDHRADLAAAGMGDGRHGFDIALDEPLTSGIAHTVEVRRSADGLRVAAMAVDAAGTWTAHLAA